MKKLAIVSIFCILVSVSCAFQKGATHYDESYDIWFEKNAKNGLITIETTPENAFVYLIEDEFEDIVQTTPAKFQVKATGKPYYFRIVREGYYDYRISVKPTPMNPEVNLTIPMTKIISSDLEELPTSEKSTVPNRPTKSYDNRIVGESNEAVQPKLESRYN